MKLCFQKSFFRFTTLKASITIFLFLCRATVVASARGFSGEGGNGGQSAGKERKGLKYLLYLYLLQIVGYQHNCLFGSYRLSFEENVLNLFVLDAIFLASLFPSRRRRPANEGGNATGKGENSRAREKTRERGAGASARIFAAAAAAKPSWLKPNWRPWRVQEPRQKRGTIWPPARPSNTHKISRKFTIILSINYMHSILCICDLPKVDSLTSSTST